MQVKKICLAVLIASALLSSGCASVENKDPLEGFNRAVYKFNDTADKAIIKPVAGAYKAVMPTPVRSGVGNFFANLSTFVSAINNVLQFKFSDAFDDAGRFVINTTFGIAGIVDVASMDGVARHNEDFGQTLGHWGVGDGAYLVLPFLGPSTLRDTGGLAVDASFFMPVLYLEDTRTRNQLLITQLIDTRSQLLPGSDLLDEAALDPYAFMRDAYLQRRHHQIEGGDNTESTSPVDNEFEDAMLINDSNPVAIEPAVNETDAVNDATEALMAEVVPAIQDAQENNAELIALETTQTSEPTAIDVLPAPEELTTELLPMQQEATVTIQSNAELTSVANEVEVTQTVEIATEAQANETDVVTTPITETAPDLLAVEATARESKEEAVTQELVITENSKSAIAVNVEETDADLVKVEQLPIQDADVSSTITQEVTPTAHETLPAIPVEFVTEMPTADITSEFANKVHI